MKIAVIGHSGAGKSCLSAFLGEQYALPVLHVDRLHYLPNWAERDDEEAGALMQAFLEENQSGWVIDGNYTRLKYMERMEKADRIIFLKFGPLSCFFRAWKRGLAYRKKSRDSRPVGCEEKLDLDFAGWILFGSRTKKAMTKYTSVMEKYPEKMIILRNQKQLDAFYANPDAFLFPATPTH